MLELTTEQKLEAIRAAYPKQDVGVYEPCGQHRGWTVQRYVSDGEYDPIWEVEMTWFTLGQGSTRAEAVDDAYAQLPARDGFGNPQPAPCAVCANMGFPQSGCRHFPLGQPSPKGMKTPLALPVDVVDLNRGVMIPFDKCVCSCHTDGGKYCGGVCCDSYRQTSPSEAIQSANTGRTHSPWPKAEEREMLEKASTAIATISEDESRRNFIAAVVRESLPASQLLDEAYVEALTLQIGQDYGCEGCNALSGHHPSCPVASQSSSEAEQVLL